MSIQRPPNLQEYLQRQEVQERIRQSIQQARSNVTVTISKAADLFGFTESRLREWEKKGLLKTDRNTAEGKEGHRRYTTNELDKLAILQELFTKGGFTLGDIPANFEGIWQQNESELQNRVSAQPISANLASKKAIDQRVEHAEQEVFWRYFTSQALRLSLMLICEDTPDVAGLILPLQKNAPFIHDPREMDKAGESLIGWLSENRSFYTFLDSSPFFEAPTDFRIEPLPMSDEDVTENAHLKNTMIIVQRKARDLNLSGALVQTVQRLLTSLYCNIEKWKPAFDVGMRDYLYQSTNFAVRPDTIDVTLNGLTDMVVELGGKSTASTAKNRWNFCCLLLPQDSSLPLQQRSLVIQAQSSDSPYKKLGNIVLSPDNPGLSLRAYQSGTMIYRPNMPEKDSIIAYKDQEKENLSALALPIVREDGLSIGVLYVASETSYAFTVEDQRVLRLIGTMISELLLTYRARQGVAVKRSDLIEKHEIVDPAFKPFMTENDFIQDLESLLDTIQKKDEENYAEDDEVAFIAIDIDNQSILATKLGNRVARNLSWEVGLRIKDHLSNLIVESRHSRLYHMNADRYCLVFDGIKLMEARHNAERLRVNLAGNYRVNVHHVSDEKPTLPKDMLEVQDVTVRLGIPAYKRSKLKQILERFQSNGSTTPIADTRDAISTAIEQVLKQGRRYGGNVIISWDYDERDYGLWEPQKGWIKN